MSDMYELTTDTKLARIEDKIDKEAAGAIEISTNRKGLVLQTMRDIMEFAKLMAIAEQAIPTHLRGKPGMCLGVCIQAMEWDMYPFAVANKSYVVNDKLAYESQLIHAVIEARAPLAKRLRCTYGGEGPDRFCVVLGTFKGEDEPHVYESPPLKIIKGKSPLWEKDPDQQLWYFAARAWARKWCPDVLMGIYTPEEAEQFEVGEHAKPVSPNLMERLPGRMSDNGFKPDVVTAGLADPPPRARRGRRKAEATQTVNIVPPAETAPSEPATQAAGPSIPVPDTPSHADAESPAASPTSGTGAMRQGSGAGANYDWPAEGGGSGSAGSGGGGGGSAGSNTSGIIQRPRIPESADEYLVYAEYWISHSKNAVNAYNWWDRDIGLRDELQVPINDRNALLRQIEQTFGVRP